jgi:DNA modification methylase
LYIASSIKEFGFTNPILIDSEGCIIAGHGRVMAARKIGIDLIPTIELSHLTETQKRAYIIADNKIALHAGWDNEMLAVELEELKLDDFDVLLTGFSLEEIESLCDGDVGDNEQIGEPKGNLSERFMIPPFSVLNAREGWWRNRKKYWLHSGIQSEVGRDKVMSSLESAYKIKVIASSNQKTKKEDISEIPAWATSSIFDPVLCEIVYRWFSLVGGIILDPFAGGSVRGIVASKLVRSYIGHELRPEQVDANRLQGDDLCGEEQYPPVWICGDSRNIDKTCSDVNADMVFSCPPYADLERYSDDPKDLSTLVYSDFKEAYFEIIKKSCERLKMDSFACFVVGEVRDKKGNYINFVGDTIQAFLDAGLKYYNEAILVTSVCTLPIRAGRQFSIGRKLGKTHQNILVFVKGDGKKAAERCGDVEVDESMFADICVDDG